MPVLGLLICIGAYCAGRALARRLLGLPGVRILGKRADSRYFSAAGARRVAYRLAGPAAAYATCVLLLFAMLVVQPQSETTTAVDVVAGGPAALAGMLTGDRVLAVDGHATASWEDVKSSIGALGPTHATSIRVERASSQLTVTATTGADGRLHVSPRMTSTYRPPGAAFIASVPMPVTLLVDAIRVQLRELSGEAVTMAGPVAVVRAVARKHQMPDRIGHVLMLTAYSVVWTWPLILIVELLLAPKRGIEPGINR